MKVKDIAKVILASMKIREESYDMKQYEIDLKTREAKHPKGFGPDPSKYYRLTLEEACEKACLKNKVDIELAKLIYLAVDGWWNDYECWASGILGIPYR